MGLFDKIINTVNEVNKIKDAINDITYTADIVCCDGSEIKKDCIYSRYNLEDMKKIKNNLYLLGNSNTLLATDEILYVNVFLAEAAHLLSYFPKKSISKSDLCFKERLINGTNAFCFATFKPLTNTDKMPKYPMELHFNISEELFGNLYYAQNGEIEKGDIVIWNNAVCYEVQLRMISNELKLHTIFRTNPKTHKKEKIYYQ